MRDGGGIQSAHAIGQIGQRAAHLDGARPALLERSIIEVRVRIGVQDFVRERRCFRSLDGNGADRAFRDAIQQALEAVQVHGFVQAIGDRLVDQRMIGNADFTRQIFRAGGLIGKHGGQQIVGSHPLDWRGHLAATLKTKDRERPRGIPAPARSKHGRRQHGLREHLFHGGGSEKLENDLEWEGMLFAERNDDAVVGGGGLQLEVE